MPMKKNVLDDLRRLHKKTMEIAISRDHESAGYLKTEQGRQVFAALGLAGEAGEVANLFKKIMRGQPIPLHEIMEEMADTYSYLQILADELKIDLDDALECKLKVYEKKIEEGLI